MAITRAIQQSDNKVAIYLDSDRYPTKTVSGILKGYTATEVLVQALKGKRVTIYNEKLQVVKITG